LCSGRRSLILIKKAKQEGFSQKLIKISLSEMRKVEISLFLAKPHNDKIFIAKNMNAVEWRDFLLGKGDHCQRQLLRISRTYLLKKMNPSLFTLLT